MSQLTRFQANSSGWRLFRFAAIIVGALFAGSCVAVWIWQGRTVAGANNPALAAHPQTVVITSPPPNIPQELATLEKNIATQETALGTEKDYISHLNDLVRVMMTAVGAFAILLAAASWKTLEDQRKNASESFASQLDMARQKHVAFIEESERKMKALFDEVGVLKSDVERDFGGLRNIVEHDFKRLRENVERDFPMFQRVRTNFALALIGIRAACSGLREDDRTYEKLAPDDRQRILYYEAAVCNSLLFNLSEFSDQLSEIYRHLGVFYGSRFFSTLEQGRLESRKDRSDLDRALFYFDRAMQIDPNDYLSHAAAGYFTQYPSDKPLSMLSRGYFRAAAALGANFQKPWISIALIELEAFKNTDRAWLALEEAARKPEYHYQQAAPATNFINYLKACTLCLRAAGEDEPFRSESLGNAVELLQLSTSQVSEYIRIHFKEDCDLYFNAMAHDPRLTKELERINNLFASKAGALPAYN